MLTDTFHVYDTTLRDGAQREGISYSVADKLAVARHLDALGVGVIEGGWPGERRPAVAENGAMVADTVAFLRGEGRRLFLDAEHFFDGFAFDPDTALRVL